MSLLASVPVASLLDFLYVGGQPQQVINGGSQVFLLLHWLLLRREKVALISLVLSILTSRNKPPQNCSELICGSGMSGEQRQEEASSNGRLIWADL